MHLIKEKKKERTLIIESKYHEPKIPDEILANNYVSSDELLDSTFICTLCVCVHACALWFIKGVCVCLSIDNCSETKMADRRVYELVLMFM